ncbi:hypothetical protein CTAYLR_008028 [Chrysophaeum taylorii]|uniref:peptide-methionine (S)-S-oxide reductase n=1 Tax=Chrysophaeum taylorii TaxID=2483200 RepID=A0AAD7U955_9STRA|nr:hypothetical protein CTAYLR_008028 [Chrysophaeum taylorii]
MMMLRVSLIACVATALQIDRRGLISVLGAAATTPVQAVQEAVEVYFGVGCFWHVQHEFAMAEKRLLGRGDDQLTARAGYAGGSGGDLVCYHNFQRVADYGKLGHGEVVSVRLPPDAVPAFAREYAKLFDDRGDRPDKLDRGSEYRSLMGLPGGMDSPLFQEASDVLLNKGMRLKAGTGNDPDTLGKRLIWVYDTAAFPFHQAEVYHQFHDGFMLGEDYPRAYNDLAMAYYERGLLEGTGCPDIV